MGLPVQVLFFCFLHDLTLDYEVDKLKMSALVDLNGTSSAK